jgi:transcriptional regulator GlxA family with amidase domain
METRSARLPAEGVGAPNNHAVPGSIARAIRFMRDNLAVNLRTYAIAMAAGVPERTLRRQFRRFTGESPVAFHRNLRLDAVHRSLRLDRRNTEVSAVAASYGFTHFGQFAARYRRRFGELPFDTLRASRTAKTTTVYGPGVAERGCAAVCH